MAKVKLLSLLTASLGLVSAYNLKPLTPVPSGRSPHHGNRTSTPSPPTVNGPGSAGLPLSRLGPHDISSLSINTSATIHHTPSTQVPDWLSFSYSQSSAPTPNPWTDVGYTIGITIITPEPVTLTSTHDQAQPQTTLTTISTPTTTSTLVPSTQPHGPDMPTTKNPAIILTARQCDPKSDGCSACSECCVLKSNTAGCGQPIAVSNVIKNYGKCNNIGGLGIGMYAIWTSECTGGFDTCFLYSEYNCPGGEVPRNPEKTRQLFFPTACQDYRPEFWVASIMCFGY